MVHDTPARRKARELRAKARELEKEAATLAGIRETEELGAMKASQVPFPGVKEYPGPS